MSTFDEMLYTVKAFSFDNDNEFYIGWYKYGKEQDVIYTHDNQEITINAYTLCRNTGIKVNGEYLYEYDMVKYSTGLSREAIGYIEWSEVKRGFVIKSSVEYPDASPISNYCLNSIVGNLFNESDYLIMKQQDENPVQLRSYVNDECRSKQHINKSIKQFLPK